jgi:hypothetical protein
VQASPDAHGSFLALDSDGVPCRFSLAMVVRVGSTPVRDLEAWERAQ